MIQECFPLLGKRGYCLRSENVELLKGGLAGPAHPSSRYPAAVPSVEQRHKLCRLVVLSTCPYVVGLVQQEGGMVPVDSAEQDRGSH